MGPASLEKLIRTQKSYVRAKQHAKAAGVTTIGGRGYSYLVQAMIRELGRQGATRLGCEIYLEAISDNPKARIVFEESAREGRGPRTNKQPPELYHLLKSNGEPTRLGSVVFRWARENLSLSAGASPSSSGPRAPAALRPKAPRLSAARDAILPFVPIDSVSSAQIRRLLPHAPEYGAAEFERLVENTIGAIHQIPRIYRGLTGARVELKQIEAYFGRSSGAPANLRRRWNVARSIRGHTYGLVFARCTVPSSLRYERHGIVLLDVLRKHDGLCISNQSMKAVGNVGKAEPGVLYMTFKILDRMTELPARELTRDQIEKIVLRKRATFGRSTNDAREVEAMKSALVRGLTLANDTSASGGYKLAHFGNDEM